MYLSDGLSILDFSVLGIIFSRVIYSFWTFSLGTVMLFYVSDDGRLSLINFNVGKFSSLCELFILVHYFSCWTYIFFLVELISINNFVFFWLWAIIIMPIERTKLRPILSQSNIQCLPCPYRWRIRMTIIPNISIIKGVIALKRKLLWYIWSYIVLVFFHDGALFVNIGYKNYYLGIKNIDQYFVSP